ncbi:thioredoxin family protein [bacterium]|nr:thioredoxin family protein [bacterium]
MSSTKRLLITVSLALCAIAGALLMPHNLSAAALEIGATAPAFSLPNVDDKSVSLSDFAGKKGVCVVFTCNHCPYAKAYEDRLIALGNEFQSQGIQFVLISPNDPKLKPEDGAAEMKKRAADKSYPFPYLLNEDGSVAKAYGAARTPEAFLLDSEMKVVYTGRIDDNTEVKDVKVHDLQNALTKLVAGEGASIDPKVTKAFGCTIKFRQ